MSAKVNKYLISSKFFRVFYVILLKGKRYLRL